MLVEDEDRVVGIGEGGIRTGDHACATHPAERVGRRPGLGAAERIAVGRGDFGGQVGRCLRTVDRTAGPQRSEQRRFEGHEVGDLYDRLLTDSRDGAEHALQPWLELSWRIGPTVHNTHVEQSLRTRTGIAVEMGDARRKVEHAAQSSSQPRGPGSASHSSRRRLMTCTS